MHELTEYKHVLLVRFALWNGIRKLNDKLHLETAKAMLYDFHSLSGDCQLRALPRLSVLGISFSQLSPAFRGKTAFATSRFMTSHLEYTLETVLHSYL